MATTPLALKHPQGRFAAGPEVEKALTRLSDGAFKLSLYLCLNAGVTQPPCKYSSVASLRLLDTFPGFTGQLHRNKHPTLSVNANVASEAPAA
jgi:hypothetical protein